MYEAKEQNFAPSLNNIVKNAPTCIRNILATITIPPYQLEY